MPALRITGMLLVACLLSPGIAAANEERAVKLPQTMQAAAIDRAGGPEVVTLHTLPVPKPAADEVLVAVNTAGVAIWDVGLRRHPQSIKHSAFPLVLGTDGAGIVAAVGAKVQGFKVGDQVYSYSWDNPHGGFYAEYVAVPAERVGHLPSGISLREAGAIATTGLTAIQGIDDYAEMVGYYVDKSGAEHGFLLSAETPNSIDYPGSTGTQAAGINNSGQIVGHYLNQVGGGKHGFLYEVRSSAVTSCSIPCSFDFPGSILTIAYGINTSGQIVGEYYDQAGNEHGFLYSGYTISGGSLSGGSFNSIDYPNAKGTSVKGINDKSQMVGHYFDTAGAAHAFIYSGWTLTGGTLGGGVSSSFDYPNASDTRAYDVNNSGQIVGIYYDKAGIEHGFLRMPQ